MVMPMSTSQESMFPPSDFDYVAYEDECIQSYNVRPRPRWVTTEFGGHVSLICSLLYKHLFSSLQSLKLRYIIIIFLRIRLICFGFRCWYLISWMAILLHYRSFHNIRYKTISNVEVLFLSLVVNQIFWARFIMCKLLWHGQSLATGSVEHCPSNDCSQ